LPPLSGAKAPIRRSTKVCCGALGYSKNQEAFSRLARILPYEQLRRTLDSEGQTAAEALLLGRASLLPSQRRLKAAGSSHVLRLEELWARRRSEPLAPELWQLSGLRPNNLPARRLAGFLRLLSRWPSLVAGLSTLEEADRAPVSRLLAAWQAPAESFWRNHHDLSGGSAAPGGALIGRGRALEMLINVVLPFAAAWGGAHSLDALSRRALALFLRLPSAGSYGGTRFLESAFRPLSGSDRGPGGACLQQGRLYLYQQYCAPANARSALSPACTPSDWACLLSIRGFPWRALSTPRATCHGSRCWKA
jgi:hypothetical protein